MKISFSIPLKPLSGKHKFAMRLANELKKYGVSITDKNPDVNLVFLKGVRKNCKNILRLDGVLMNNKMNYIKKNLSLKKEIAKCDGVIYQNSFCKRAADKFLGKVKKYAVISNGAELPMGSIPYKHDKPYLLTISRWRPHKRLKATVDSFLESGIAEEYDLIVLGNPDYNKNHPSIKYVGQKKDKQVWSYILGSKYVVHLAYIDWCPNSVVESLIAGKNVLHSSTGGTKDLVKKNGICVPDKPWNLKAIDLYSPPKLDSKKLKTAYSNMLRLPPANANELDIANIARLYLKFCKKICS